MRSQKANVACKHLSNSKDIFLKLLAISRSLDNAKIAQLRAERDYEELEMYIINSLLNG